MDQVLNNLETAIAGFNRAVAVAEACHAWERPSPCAGWTARDVVDHVAGGYVGLVSEFGVEVARQGDPQADWMSARDALLAVANRHGALNVVVNHPAGEMPFGRMIGVLVTTDTLVHTWDLARAVGADDSLDEELCRRAYERALPADTALRASGLFGPKVHYAEEDPIQVKLLRFYGRVA